MQETPNYRLKKPEENDYVDIAALNHNMDVIDAALPTVQVGGLEPEKGPCIWFDTSGGAAPHMVFASLELGGPGGTAELMAQVDSTDYPISNAKTGGTPKAGEYKFDIL